MTSPTVPPELLDTCRRIFLRDYVLQIGIGIHDFEQRVPQRVIVNVDLYVPLASSTPIRDTIGEVVDYDFIREVVADCVNGGHIGLQETLCDNIAAQLLAHDDVVAVRVSTAKPDVYPGCAAIGVELFRRR